MPFNERLLLSLIFRNNHAWLLILPRPLRVSSVQHSVSAAPRTYSEKVFVVRILSLKLQLLSVVLRSVLGN